MNNIAIKVENVSKQYRLGEVGKGTLKDDFKRFRYKIMGKDDPFLQVGDINDRTSAATQDYVWALKDINFEIEQGDIVGVIGRNGAGKSTLLKILSRTTGPTTGTVKMRGRIASLLEVGTGFHPELSGRENIYLNGTIMGIRKNEIKSKLDEIIQFAGVEKYIDTPVKRYSSGMYVRLAFAVAAHLEPDILIVDEVLAVGDFEFQQKCLGKLKDVSRKSGRTILFVSHNINSILTLCNKGILLSNGQLLKNGNIGEIVSDYKSALNGINEVWSSKEKDIISNVIFELISSKSEQKLKITIEVRKNKIIRPCFIAFDIHNSMGLKLFQALPSSEPFISNVKNSYSFEIQLVGLIPDVYSLSIWLGSHFSETVEHCNNVMSFEVFESPTIGRTFPHNFEDGYIVPNSKYIN